MDDSVIKCDQIIDGDTEVNLYNEAKSYDKETITILKNFNEKEVASKKQNFHILLAFLLTTIALLIAVIIYCYLIKYRAKKHLLPFHVTNNKLKEVMYY